MLPASTDPATDIYQGARSRVSRAYISRRMHLPQGLLLRRCVSPCGFFRAQRLQSYLPQDLLLRRRVYLPQDLLLRRRVTCHKTFYYADALLATRPFITPTRNEIIECNLCALKKPHGETRRRNKRSCGKCILRDMYARGIPEQAPW